MKYATTKKFLRIIHHAQQVGISMSNKLVLVLNCGSSSLKFAIINAVNGEKHISGLAECFTLPNARIKWDMDGIKQNAALGNGSAHHEALHFIVNTILAKKPEISAQLTAIGHRIVHGGERFTQSTIINDEVLKGIEDSISFAPLHNPAHLIGIHGIMKIFPELANKNVAVFDTAFHQTMPEEAYLYALPYSLYQEHSIRRYGAHGTSHFYVTREAAKLLNKPLEKINLITCHLGNGGSVSAICNGQCVDTSMGLTPLEGLVMGTRSGDIDPAIIFHLHDTLGMSVDKINILLTKKSGLLGLTGITSDCRYIEENYTNKEDARRAMHVYCHRLAKYIGAYSTLMEGRLDSVIFTGGIGENAAMIRELTLKKLVLLGFDVDQERNLTARFGQSGVITTDSSRPAIVIPTNEELVIAQDAVRLTAQHPLISPIGSGESILTKGVSVEKALSVSRTIMLIPTDTNVGLTSISLGIIRAMEQKGVRLSVFKPIAQSRSAEDTLDSTTRIIRANSSIPSSQPLSMNYVESLLGSNQQEMLMEKIIARYHENTHNKEVVLVEGLVPTLKHQFANALNYEIAKMLDAEIIFVLLLKNDSSDQLKERIELARSSFGGNKNKNITGLIINKLNAPIDEQGRIRPDLSEIFDDSSKSSTTNIDPSLLFKNSPLPILGCIPWNSDLIATRVIDMARHLGAEIIHAGEIQTRRVKSVTFCARSLPNMLEHFRPSSLLVTSADRPDVLIAACLAAMNGVKIGAVLLTGGYAIDPRVHALCERAFQTGLPMFTVQTNTWQTSLNLQSFNLEVPADDHSRVEKLQNYIASYIHHTWIESLTTSSKRSRRLSPPAFRYQLTELARKARKRIVLPEGDEPRTVKAAAICAARGIAYCILLGNSEEIHRVAAAQGVTLEKDIKIVDPEVTRAKYVTRLVELRKNKGMTELVAREQLEDNVMLGTLMLEQGEVDGLVSGAVHTTANTIRPPLQLIKTAPGNSLVSSVFFMLLPEQVLVYGDCAINPDPTAEQLAEIAIQSADSATAFGIEPRVAMISYSTGNSGSGSDVEKVREATRQAKKKRPDLMIDGPLQYDAAIMADVALSKAPNSPVAGKATVFIFPDLNTGNTTYKAVQRSANLLSIGPMLQGMRKPVNDLSRGASVDDIVYTVALTAIQSKQTEGSSF